MGTEWAGLVGAAGVVLFAIRLFLDFRESAKRDRKIEERISAAESRVEAEPAKAAPAWDLARATLEKYFNRNLSQVAAIFWVSIAAMALGFLVIVWGIARAVSVPDAPLPGAIASGAGLLTEFIGATFLFLYRSAIQQASAYTQTLERINSVGMAMQILDTMPDQIESEDLKNNTKSVLVELLVREAYQKRVMAVSR